MWNDSVGEQRAGLFCLLQHSVHRNFRQLSTARHNTRKQMWLNILEIYDGNFSRRAPKFFYW
jgi:hypothetical protein